MNLHSQIQEFYDTSTPLWLDIWGEHMHHGYYGPNGDEDIGVVSAQLKMIEALLAWANINEVSNILDAGCGVGGSARYLSKKYQAQVLGLTLSSIQVKYAEQFTRLAKLQPQVQFAKRDMMTLNDQDGPYDLIWSMESAEHIQEKQKLFDLFFNHLVPGGKLIMATWCHRETPPVLKRNEAKLLARICEFYHLPPWVSISSLSEMATKSGFTKIKTDDWSLAVAPFWNAVIRSAFTWRGMRGLMHSGVSTIKGAWAMRYMKQGFRNRLIKFGVLTCEKRR